MDGAKLKSQLVAVVIAGLPQIVVDEVVVAMSSTLAREIAHYAWWI